MNQTSYTMLPFSAERRVIADGGRIAARRHTVYGLIEVDVTTPRALLRAHKARAGETLSFTAFALACLGKAIDENKRVHAYRDWRNRLFVFDQVDINTMMEINVDGRQMTLPHFVRAANQRDVRAIHAELRAAQAQPRQTREFGLRWFTRLPQFARDFFYWYAYGHPTLLKQAFCTVGLTALGMFGKGGWAIPFGVHTLDVALGGITAKPGCVAGRVEPREYLCVTLCFDHDIMDGAPAGRFAARFQELLERGDGLTSEALSSTASA